MKTVLQIDVEKCTSCGLCVRDCMVKVLRFDAARHPAIAPEDEPFCIRCQHCLAVCPSGALSIFGISPEDCPPVGALPEPERMRNLFRQRRSIRHFDPEPLSPETLDTLAASLSWSPTGCNDHRLWFRIAAPCEVRALREATDQLVRMLIRTGLMRLFYPNYKRYLGEILGGADMVYRGAPHLVVAASPKNAPCAKSDPVIALSYFDALIQSMNLGSCWCGFAEYALRFSSRLRKLAGVPKGYRVGAVMLFGRPAVHYARATRPAPYKTVR